MKAYRSLNVSFGLINVPVSIAPLFKEDKVSGNYICAEHHQKVGIKYDCPTCNTAAKRVIGYEQPDGTFIVPDESDLKGLEADSKKVISLEGFTKVSSLDPIWFDKSYVMWPKTGAEDGFALLSDAFRSEDLAGVGVVVLDKSEVPVAIRYSGAVGRLVMHVCHFDAELRRHEIDNLGDVVTAPVAQVEAAKQLISNAVTTWNLAAHVDTYQRGLRDLIYGGSKQEQKEKQGEFIAALKESVAKKKAPAKQSRRTKLIETEEVSVG